MVGAAIAVVGTAMVGAAVMGAAVMAAAVVGAAIDMVGQLWRQQWWGQP